MEEVNESVITFWCQYCHLDWKLVAVRQFRNSILGTGWMARCPECDRNLFRLINDAANDPYYRRSKNTRADRRRYARDLLQPGDPMFDIIYPQMKREKEEKEAREEAKKQIHLRFGSA